MIYPPAFDTLYSVQVHYETGGDLKDGGWNKTAGDRGKETQWGISLAGNPDLAAELKGRTLQPEAAKMRAYARYYKAIPGIDKLPIGLQFILYDAMFQGWITHRGDYVKMAQKYNGMIGRQPLPGTGKLDQLTISELSSWTPGETVGFARALEVSARPLGELVARRVIAAQKRDGQQEVNLSDAFEHRFSFRARAAQVLCG